MNNRREFLKSSTAGLAAITLSSNALAQSVPSVSLSFAPAGNICDYNSLPDYKIYVGAGKPYGSWADGPLNPYRRSSADVMRAVVPHSENRTLYLVPGAMAAPSLSPVAPMTMTSARIPQMGSMDMRHWLFSVFNVDQTQAFAVAHSENYTELSTDAGTYWPNEGSSTFQWFNSLSLFKTVPRTGDHDQFTYAFSPQPFSGTTTHSDNHLIIHPALPQYGRLGKVAHYGFLHPSNLIEDSGYVYTFAQHIPATRNPTMADPFGAPDSPEGKAGPVLLRCATSLLGQTGNPNNRNGHYWEIFNNVGAWQYITRWEWADASVPEAPIKPYVFYRGNLPGQWMANMAMAQAVRKVGSKFVVLGVAYPGALHFSYCTTLANPLELENHLQSFGQGHPFGGAFNLQSGAYMSVFDPSDADLNYRNVAQNGVGVVLAVRDTQSASPNDNYGRYMRYTLSFTGF